MNRLAKSGGTSSSGTYREFAVEDHSLVRRVWMRETGVGVGLSMFAVARTSPSVVAHLWDDGLDVEDRGAGELVERALSPRAVGFVLHPWAPDSAVGALHGAVARTRWRGDGFAGIRGGVAAVLGRCDAVDVGGDVRALVCALERRPERGVQQQVTAGLDWSGRTVRRRFRSTVGMSADRFRVVARVARARQALLTEGATLVGVSTGLGFSDQSHLHRDFVALCGYTPSQWQARAASWSSPSDAERSPHRARRGQPP